MPYDYWSKQVSQCEVLREKIHDLDYELNKNSTENYNDFNVKIDRMLFLAEECLDDLGPYLSDSQYESVIVWNNEDEYNALLSEVLTLINELKNKIADMN